MVYSFKDQSIAYAPTVGMRQVGDIPNLESVQEKSGASTFIESGRSSGLTPDIAHNQQVNNRLCMQNELLEKTDGQRLDGGTLQEAVRVDSEVATVGKEHRAKNKRRQS